MPILKGNGVKVKDSFEVFCFLSWVFVYMVLWEQLLLIETP